VHSRSLLPLLLVLIASFAPAEEPPSRSAFRIRPYLQHPAADAMTIQWFSESQDSGIVVLGGREYFSEPILCLELAYHPLEPREHRHAVPPFLHSVRINGLEPSTSYPYSVEQDGETIKAILTTSPRPGEVGKGGGVRLFFYGDSKTEPESRGSRTEWSPSPSMPAQPRPRWVRDRYLADETSGYRMNLALIASRAAESLRAKNPVLVSVVGDLVANGAEQRDWDEFWRHNAGDFGSLASRVPIVAAIGDHDIGGDPALTGSLESPGGDPSRSSLVGSMKFLTYFDHPSNNASDERHEDRYHRVDFGPVTLITLDTTNSGPDDGDDDTNHSLDHASASHIPDLAPGSEQYEWLERELADAAASGRIILVQYHHAAFSSGPHGRPSGSADGFDLFSGQPLRALAPLFTKHRVRAVFAGHDEMYEHSLVDGIHYFNVGIGGDRLAEVDAAAANDRQVFVANDHAPERWNGDVLTEGGRHYGHVEVDVTRAEKSDALHVSITPIHVFPVLDPQQPGSIVRWERREYGDRVEFDVETDSRNISPAAKAPP
jgi:hypothetical protein